MYKLFKFTMLFWLAAGISGAAAQTINSADILIKDAPELQHVCIFEPTDFNVNRAIAHADIVGKRAANQKTSQFNVTYESACGGESWPSEARSAFEYAMSIWETHLESVIPVAIEANWVGLDSRVLGSAGPTLVANIPTGQQDQDTWYTVAQASAMTGRDTKSEGSVTDEYDIIININCEFTDWYFGQDADPPPKFYDFVTVVLHEIGHGIGFIGSMAANNDNRTAKWGVRDSGIPLIYDRFSEEGDGISLLNENIYTNPSSQLYDALTGSDDGVFFDGIDANMVNSGSPVRLYTPFPWDPGSSYSHLDQNTFGDTDNALMRPELDSQFSIHTPGPVMCGMLSDMGWPLGQNCYDLIGVESVISVEQTDFNFGISNVSDIVNQTLTVSNDASAEDALSGRIVIENSNYTVPENFRTFTIEPGSSLNIPIRYAPRSIAIHEAELTLLHNSANQPNPLSISLRGEALQRNSMYVLDQNYPNPFNSQTQTTIEYAITGTSDVLLEVYNTTGQLIRTLVDTQQGEGRYSVDFSASGLASGVYLYRIIVDGEADTRKLLLVK